jgi:hypothetical protein
MNLDSCVGETVREARESIRRGDVVVCKWTDSPTTDCPDVCLEALDCKNGSECWKIATRGPVGRIL